MSMEEHLMQRCEDLAEEKAKLLADVSHETARANGLYLDKLEQAKRITALGDTVRSLVGLCRGAWPDAPDRDVVDRALEGLKP